MKRAKVLWRIPTKLWLKCCSVYILKMYTLRCTTCNAKMYHEEQHNTCIYLSKEKLVSKIFLQNYFTLNYKIFWQMENVRNENPFFFHLDWWI